MNLNVLRRYIREVVSSMTDDADEPWPVHLNGDTEKEDFGPVPPRQSDDVEVLLDPYVKDVW